MDFANGSGPLTSQVKQLLQDGPMFQFLCERSFQNHAVDGVVTLPAVAPMVEGVLKSLGRPVLPTEVHGCGMIIVILTCTTCPYHTLNRFCALFWKITSEMRRYKQLNKVSSQ